MQNRYGVAAEVRRLAADLPLLGFQRQERRLEEAFVDILRKGAGSIKRRGPSSPPPLPTAAAEAAKEVQS